MKMKPYSDRYFGRTKRGSMRLAGMVNHVLRPDGSGLTLCGRAAGRLLTVESAPKCRMCAWHLLAQRGRAPHGEPLHIHNCDTLTMCGRWVRTSRMAPSLEEVTCKRCRSRHNTKLRWKEWRYRAGF